MRKRNQSYSERQAKNARVNRAQLVTSDQDVYTHFSEEIDRGPLNPERRAVAEESFVTFCKTYGAAAFTLSWSDYHLSAAAKVEAAAKSGGMFAFAMPRGSGKSTLCHWSVLWSVLCGHSPYAVLIGATDSSAKSRLKALKTTLRFNELLFEDFPEVCCSVRHMRGEARRASGQKFHGEPTAFEWMQNRIVLPTIPAAYGKASGSIIDVCGITGNIRGRSHERPDGSVLRPTLAIADDVQTRESARSPSQTEAREAILLGDVKYMAGPDRPIALLAPCTVIYPGDLADRLMDRKLHPELQGERTKMLIEFPTNEKLWDEYAEIRSDSFRNGGDGSAATDFYRKNREAMDAGAEVSWADRYFEGELSAIQHAMNLKIQDEASFQAEYQNEPIIENDSDLGLISLDALTEKTNGVKQGVVPDSCTKLTAFVDVSKKVMWWAVVGWENNFTGYVIDYGVWPKQNSNYVTLATAKTTLMMKKRGAGFEAALLAGLKGLTDEILDREWLTESGNTARIDHCLIDEGYATEQVRNFCRRSKFANILTTSKGVAWKASSRHYGPNLGKPSPGETRGTHWTHYRNKHGRRILVDVFHWKTFLFNRLAVPVGDPGALSLFETKPARHRMFAEQVTAEIPIKTEGQGQIVYEWKTLPSRPDNHFLDCLVGCTAAASMLGLELGGKRLPPKRKKKRRKRVYAMS